MIISTGSDFRTLLKQLLPPREFAAPPPRPRILVGAAAPRPRIFMVEAPPPRPRTLVEREGGGRETFSAI